MATHDLKIWPEYFEKVYMGKKNFEIRENDRDFKEGDILRLREWDIRTSEYTGRTCVRYVKYIMYGGLFGIKDGYCVMGLS